MVTDFVLVPIDFVREINERNIEVMVDSCPDLDSRHQCEGVRITLGVPRRLREYLDEVMDRTGTESTKDLMNNALSLYVYMLKKEQGGEKIGVLIPESGEIQTVTFQNQVM